MSYLPCVEIEPKQPAKASVIWLHGLGANGHDFEPVVPELRLPSSLPVRFVFPHAPSIPITINGGMVMPAWYDILELSFERKLDLEHLMQSADAITQLIEREIERGVDSRNIVLIGFSQGGAVAYQAGLTFSQPLGGLIGLSTYFASSKSIEPHEANGNIPIHIFHGTADPVVPEAMGRQSQSDLEALGYSPSYQSYPVEHTVCLEEVHAISQAIQNWTQA